MQALSAKLARFKGQGGTSAFWRPKEGRQHVRIVPWSERPENPFIEMYFHYLGGRTNLSPKSHGKPDPMIEFADELLREDNSKDTWETARKFYPKLRTYVPVVVRGEEDQGVRYWSFGKTVFQDILSYIADPDYGDITDPLTGRDLTVEYIPQEKSDTNFAKTTVKVRPKVTPAVEDDEQMDAILNNQPNFRALFTEPTYEELYQFLQRQLSGESETDSSAGSSVATESLTPTSAPSEGSPAPVSAATDKFAQMFEDL